MDESARFASGKSLPFDDEIQSGESEKGIVTIQEGPVSHDGTLIFFVGTSVERDNSSGPKFDH